MCRGTIDGQRQQLGGRGGIPCRRTRFSWGSEDSPLCGGFVLRVKMHAQAVLRPQRSLFFFHSRSGAAAARTEGAVVDRLGEGFEDQKASNRTCASLQRARVGSEGLKGAGKSNANECSSASRCKQAGKGSGTF